MLSGFPPQKIDYKQSDSDHTGKKYKRQQTDDTIANMNKLVELSMDVDLRRSTFMELSTAPT